ncbi:MAG: hypothetical protein [Caudoviricetes sp.]|nr:MAG: hypothetical protein [Caudoviricetes sp.]
MNYNYNYVPYKNDNIEPCNGFYQDSKFGDKIKDTYLEGIPSTSFASEYNISINNKNDKLIVELNGMIYEIPCYDKFEKLNDRVEALTEEHYHHNVKISELEYDSKDSIERIDSLSTRLDEYIKGKDKKYGCVGRDLRDSLALVFN